eukprot:s4221_g5.t1
MSEPIDSCELAQHLAVAQERALEEECQACRDVRAELHAERREGKLQAAALGRLQLALANAALELRNEVMNYEVVQAREERLESQLCEKNLEVEVTQMRSYQAVFVEQVFKAAMSSAGTYDAACNLFWVNFKWSAAPKVPINRDAAKRLQTKMFAKGPVLFDRPTVIAVAEDLIKSQGMPSCSL